MCVCVRGPYISNGAVAFNPLYIWSPYPKVPFILYDCDFNGKEAACCVNEGLLLLLLVRVY